MNTQNEVTGGRVAARECPTCKGNGLDKKHKWPDGSFASCETCEGYGTIEPRSQFAALPDDVKENIGAMVRSHELSAILNEIGEATLNTADENGLDEQAQDMADDARIVFHAAAHVSN